MLLGDGTLSGDSAATTRVAAREQSRVAHPQKVIGVRPDGLGIRLQCLLMTMYYAELLNADYGVVWPDPTVGLEHHAVLPAGRTFTKAFCATHIAERPADTGYVELDQPVEDVEGLAALANGRRGWLVRKPHVLDSLPADLRPTQADFRRLFDTIPFQPRLSAAIQAARAAPLEEGMAAVHIRAGDIVYGKHRLGARYTRKVICLPVARRLVETLRAKGRTVVLFTQDPFAAELFRKTPGVIVAGDMFAKDDVVAQALFEIALMSRCAEIYAGNSVFAQIGEMIGQGVLIDPRSVFKSSEQADIIETDLIIKRRRSSYPPLQTAFAAWSAAEMLSRRNPARAVDLLKTAIRFDPVNACYVLRRVALMHRVRRGKEAEAIVEATFVTGPNAGTMRPMAVELLRKAGIGGRASILVSDRALLAKAAEANEGPIRDLLAEVTRLEARLARARRKAAA